jgi:signal transduction histidine kinase
MLRKGRLDLSRYLAMLALLLLDLATLVAGILAFLHYSSIPDAGFVFSAFSYDDVYGGKATVGRVDPRGPAAFAGLEVGDDVLRINGISPMEGKAFFRPNQRALKLEIVRQGQKMSLTLDLTPPSSTNALTLNTIGYYLTALAFWFIATAVLFFKPKDSVAQTFVSICLLATLAIIILPIASLGALWSSMAMAVLQLVAGPVFVYYHTVFPERQEFKGKRALLAAVSTTSGILLLRSTVSAILESLYPGMDVPLAGVPLTRIYFSLCLLGGFGLLVRTFWVTRSARSRRQIGLITVGTGLGFLPLIVFVVLPQVLGSAYILPTWPVLMMLIFIPLSYFYAAVRHNLMKFDRAVNRSVVLIILSTIFVLLYLCIRWLTPSVSFGTVTLVDVLFVVMVVFSFGPLQKGVQRLVDSAFYGGWYNYETVVSCLSRELNNALEMPRVVDLVVHDWTEAMRFKEAALLLPDSNGGYRVRRHKGFDATTTISSESGLPAFLLKLEGPVAHGALHDKLRVGQDVPPALLAWGEAGAQMWVPLVYQKDLKGILVLGGKMADEFYSREDHHILMTLANQAAVAISRVELIEELHLQIQEIEALSRVLIALQERNQRRMAQELHDLVLQDLYGARSLLDPQALDPDKVARAHEMLQQISLYLRSAIFEMRPPSWSRTDLQTLLEDWASNFEQQEGLPVIFQAKDNSEGTLVPEEVRLAVYRIFQECLNNVKKHAGAKLVWAVLDLQPDGLRLSVRDNGVGFEVPRHLGTYLDGYRFGLHNMRARASDVGGTFELESQPGKGTHITVSMPLSAP